MAKRFLSLDEIVSEAMTIIPGATSEDALIAKQWAYTALRDLGPTKEHVDVCTLYPHDYSLKKPDDFYSAIDIALFAGTPDSPKELRYKYRGGKKRIHQKIDEDLFSGCIEISEDENFFHLSSNSNDVTYAILRYFKLPVDKDGCPMFPENCRIPVMLFIRYMWSLRMNDPSWRVLEQSYKIARSEVRGKNKLPNGLQFKQFAKEWMSLMPNNKFDRF